MSPRLIFGFLLAATFAGAFAQDLEEPPRVPLFAPKKWAICIGTQNYQKITPLKYAARDALDFGAALQSELGFTKESVRVLADTEGQMAATAQNVNKALDDLLADRALDRGDLFVVYFSGHGVGLEDGDYWLPNDADPKDPKIGAIRIESMISKLVAKKMRNVVVISDACRAGEKNSFGSRLIALGRKANIAILLGCAPGAKSYESAKLGHGVFTNYLLKNLRNEENVEKGTGALRVSTIGKRLATAVEGYTKADYGTNAQKPLILADQEQDVIIASFVPKDATGNQIFALIEKQIKDKTITLEDARASLFLAAFDLELSNQPDQALQIYRQLYSLGEDRASFFVQFVRALIANGRTSEAERVMGQMLDNPQPSAWVDILSVIGPKSAVSNARLANAANSLFTSEFRDILLGNIDLAFSERGMNYEREVLWGRMEKLSGTTWPAYARVARQAFSSKGESLISFLTEYQAANPGQDQLDIASRLTYLGLIRNRRFEECVSLVNARLATDPGNGYWAMKRLVVATVLNDPKRNDLIVEQLGKCSGGRFALGCTLLLGPDTKLFLPQFTATSVRLKNSYEARVAAWVAEAMQDLDKLAVIPEAMRKLAPTDYEEYSVPFLALSDALDRKGGVEKVDASKVHQINYGLALSLEDDWRDKKIERADALADIYVLLSRSDQVWRIPASYIFLEENQIEALSPSVRPVFYRTVLHAMLAYGNLAAAEAVLQTMEQSSQADASDYLRYALSQLLSGYRDGANEKLVKARKSKLFGIELTLSRLIDIHIAILDKDQKSVESLVDNLPRDLQFTEGLLQYSHYLSLLNKEQVVLTEEATKDFLAGNYELHQVWSAVVNLALSRLETKVTPSPPVIFDSLTQAVAEDPLNQWFDGTKVSEKPSLADFAGSYEFVGLFASPSSSAEATLKFNIDKAGLLAGEIYVETEKATVQVRGEILETGQVNGEVRFPSGTTAAFKMRLMPKKFLDSLKPGEMTRMMLIVNSGSPAGVAFIVADKLPPPKQPSSRL